MRGIRVNTRTAHKDIHSRTERLPYAVITCFSNILNKATVGLVSIYGFLFVIASLPKPVQDILEESWVSLLNLRETFGS